MLHFLAACYSICLTLALWALFMTIWVGPGFAEDLFVSEKLQPLQLQDEPPQTEKSDTTLQYINEYD